MKNLENLALEASAGTGKTYSLTIRFIALVLSKDEKGYKSISNILAITFTNKAANEMKERIISSFINLANKTNELKDIAKLLDINEEEVLKRRNERQKDFLSTELKIYTFDAFFGQILRQFSLNVGLMPDFEIDLKLDYKINENYIKSLANKQIDDLAKYIINSNFLNALTYLETIKQMSLYDISFNPYPKPDAKSLICAFNKLKSIAQPKTEAKYQYKFENLNKIKDMADLVFNGIKATKKAIDDCPFEKDEFISELKKYYEEFKKYKISNFFEHIKEYKNIRTKTLKELNKLDFSDVSMFLYKMLKKDENSNKEFDINELYFRLDSRITDILIDEFQDTNSLQYEIMLPLIREALSGLGQNDRVGSFFYVGDIKQSIYAFRDAHKDIFEHLYKKKFKEQIATKSLNINFRSDENIVEFIDNVFLEKIPTYEKQKANSKESGYVEICSFKGANCKEEFPEFEDILIQKIELLKSKNINESDITILCWENKDIIYLKEILLEKGFKVASKAKKLTELQHIKIIIAYLEYCLFKNNFHKLYLEQFGINVENNIKIFINQPEILLKNIALKVGIDEFEPNMLLLYELACKSKNIYEFLSFIKKDDTKAHQSSNDGINIMTVHSSKGLGFDHTIVCDNLNQNRNFSSVFLSYFDLDKNEWEITLDDRILDFIEDAEHKKIKEKVEKIQNDEELNKLYVAFTRAKHSLIILCAQSRHGSVPSYFKAYGAKCDKISTLELNDEIIGNAECIKNYQKDTQKLQDVEILPFEKVSRQEVLSENKESQSSIKTSSLNAVYFGKALHYAFEMSGDFSDEDIQNGVQASFNKYGYLLENNAFKSIGENLKAFSKLQILSENSTFLKEHELAYDNEILRLDALILAENSAIILDYKSSQNAALASKEQMKLYKKAVNQIYRCEAKAYFVIFHSNSCELLEV